MAPNPYLEAALRYHAWGANVIAISAVGNMKSPAHRWTSWQSARQSAADVRSLPWDGYTRQRDGVRIEIAGVGIINGVNGWRDLDFDGCADFAPVVTALQTMGLPADYPWVVRTGSGRGWRLIVACADDLPAGVLTPKADEKAVFTAAGREGAFDHVELRWSHCQSILPPSRHASGGSYCWRSQPPTGSPAPVRATQLLAAFFAVSQPGQIARPQAAPEHRADGRREVEEIRHRFDLLAYARQRFPGEAAAEGDEVRIHGHGGLLLKPKSGEWYCHRDGVGGDALDLAGYHLYGAQWDRHNREMFRAALQEAAQFAGVELGASRQQDGQRQAEPEQHAVMPTADRDGADRAADQEAPSDEPTPPAQPDPVADESRAQDRVQTALHAVAETQDPGLPFAVVDELAQLPQTEYMRARDRFKQILGRALDLRDLGRAVTQARRQREQRRFHGVAVRHLNLPQIVVNNRQLRDVSQEALHALAAANQPPALFIRSSTLIHLQSDEKHRPILSEVNTYYLRHRLTAVADFAVIAAGKEPKTTAIFPPLDLARDILAREEWPFPPVEAIIETPALRPDGSLLDRPGYDPQTQLIYVPAPGLQVPPIPDRPTGAQVAAAIDLIDEAIGEFPYRDAASRANAFGLLVTAAVRPAIHGNVPMPVIDAPKAGTGKSLLAEVVAVTATGRPAAMMSGDKADEEWRKSITATLLEGATFVVADNIEQPLWAPSLARALTARVWKDRLLSTNQAVEVTQRAIWIATGNQMRLRGDLPRRAFWIRLNAGMARPWQRTGFKHPDLLGWVGAQRGAIIAALLTLARAWYAAGQPPTRVKPLGNFEEWVRIIGGILENAHIGSFLSNLDEQYDQSAEDEADWETFLYTWEQLLGTERIMTSDLAQKLADDAYKALREALPEARLIESFEKDKPGSFSRKLGRVLANKADVCFGPRNLRLLRADKDARSGSPIWQLVSEPALAAS